MSHRFCLVAPGDFVATHKITEAVALGGAGGCIPLFVLPTKHRVESMLLHAVAGLLLHRVRRARSRRAASAAVIDEPRAPSRRDGGEARGVEVARDAFVVRRNASAAAPAAAQYVLAEVRDAERMRGAKTAKARRRRGGGDLAGACCRGRRRRREYSK